MLAGKFTANHKVIVDAKEGQFELVAVSDTVPVLAAGTSNIVEAEIINETKDS
jgi:hypothetical protein